ncbi:hypothetical protein, partial [Streptomyces milbemycinicus]
MAAIGAIGGRAAVRRGAHTRRPGERGAAHSAHGALVHTSPRQRGQRDQPRDRLEEAAEHAEHAQRR